MTAQRCPFQLWQSACLVLEQVFRRADAEMAVQKCFTSSHWRRGRESCGQSGSAHVDFCQMGNSDHLFSIVIIVPAFASVRS